MMVMIILLYSLFYSCQLIDGTTKSDLWWNIGLERRNDNILSSYSFANSDHQYAVEDDPSSYCQSSLKSLTIGQKQICLLYADHMPVVIQGASKGIEECQNQFQDRHWNCSTVRDGTVFGPVLYHANRETAFTHAMLSAGVTYAVSRACKQGLLKSCTCSRAARPKNLPRDWAWGGCGDNIDYGYRFGRDFVDTPEKEVNPNIIDSPVSFINTNQTNVENEMKRKPLRRSRIRRQMNIHNNEAGRRAVYRLTRVVCKCHGVSGSCSLRTCYQQLPTFREIGAFLKEKYDSAIEVRYQRRLGQLRSRDRRFTGPTKDDLIYFEDSNFCEYNRRIGSFGTKGRQCNRTSHGPDGCGTMCCGRGYNTIRKVVQEKCNCKFIWCCSVQCQTCQKLVEIHICK
ncbi:unnamed protein product [Rotaria socialis]|uniref:Protein Wnt n=3 Tax=Rotaria socialis TaxID=392032 RepID=A0A821HB83_9BILA|nr:unnamed protein product [Rotaria socialis]CAF4682877.1 unnamed protein product [Rotaria socialis]